jgi:hypothetical protein
MRMLVWVSRCTASHMGNALWMDYQDLLERPVKGDATTAQERRDVLAALARQGALGNGVFRLAA